MKKRKKDGRIIVTFFWIFFFSVLVITIGSLIFFNIQINDSAMKEEIFSEKVYDAHYVMITSDNSSPFWQSVYKSAREEAEKENVLVELSGDDLTADYTIEQKLEIAIASGVDGIIIEGNNSYRGNALIDTAEERNIPVITVLGDSKDSERKSFVGVSNFEMGKQYGKQICSIMKEKLKNHYQIKILQKNSNNFEQDFIYSGIKESMQQLDPGKYSINIEKIDQTSTFATEEIIRDLFIRKDIPDILVCLDVNATTCAYQAVVDYNRVGKTNILGYYITDTIANAIDRGVINSTISVDTGQMGKACVDAITEYRKMGYVSEYMMTDTVMIDSKNVKEYMNDEDTVAEEPI